ncbi:Inactivation-no-after-potential D protein [Papilio machaon]|uniref:Inactivation-no-after-potential D protein n=1 Tax=Papilio machaon TaxID=76193 RepID=A0A0N1INF6_PAPMA|nr:Inactivation-no-after-potential D protein [Papilio machaon]
MHPLYRQHLDCRCKYQQPQVTNHEGDAEQACGCVNCSASHMTPSVAINAIRFNNCPVVDMRWCLSGLRDFSRGKSSHVSPNMTVTVSPDRHTVGAQRWGPPRSVTLKRNPGAPLGVSIVGGKVDIISHQNTANGSEKAIFGIFIKNVVPDSPAGLCGELHTGDRILEVDGVCVRTAQHERAVQLIKAAGNTVTLTVQSLMAWNNDSSDVDVTSPAPSRTLSYKKGPAPPPPTTVNQAPKHDIKITVTSEAGTEKEGEIDAEKEPKEKGSSETESSKPVYSDSESSDEEDERELSGRTYSEKGVEIDRASAGAIKRTREEKEADPEEEDDFGYTTSEWKDTLFTFFNFSFYLIHVYFYSYLLEHNR